MKRRVHGQADGVAPIKDDNPSTSNLGYASRHALVIGIDEYEDPGFPDLGHAAADAKGIAKLLVDHLKFEKDRVRLVLNEDATKAGIEQELEDWASDPEAIAENEGL